VNPLSHRRQFVHACAFRFSSKETVMSVPLRHLALALAAAAAVSGAHAADRVKIGFLSTLSGPGAGLGIDIRDGFNLALKHSGGKLGGLPAEVIVADDQQSPDAAKQTTERLLKRDKVDFMTGVVFSNVMLAVGQPIFDAKTFYVSANAGPSQYAGEQCNPYFFNVAWQNDNLHEAVGKTVADKGFKKVALLAPNYPAGKDALTGFKRYYKGEVVQEVYTRLGQLDYAAELAQVRASQPDAMYIFLPGGMGINFIEQFVASGLSKDVTLFGPGFSADEDVIRAVGEPMLGMFNTSQWAHDMDNPQNKRFVADFQKEYGRLPSLYASQGYDAAMLIDAAVRDVKGKIEDKEAVRRALKAANFKSVRGPFKFNTNQYPVQDYYLRVVTKDPQGRVTNRTLGTVFKNHADAYVGACKMR
jgi:branched-chain amino acid transport system substrate-binding protein